MAQEADEVRIRRAVSAAYYALYHALADDGARQVAGSNYSELQFRVRRVFEHTEMREVCFIFAK